MTDKNPTPPSPDGRTGWRSILLLLTVAGTAFALMQTLVVPALPFFQREFDTTANGVAWIVTGFLLSSSVLTPVLGKLGDTYGKKRLLVISLVVFGVGALGAAVSWSLESLIAFRVLQGAGAAVFPLSFGIIRDEFPPEKVGLGIGVVSSVFGAGGGVGLVASGIILEYLDWHWLFLIGGIPVLVAAAVIARHVPESRTLTPTKPDYAGAAALSFALATLLLGISQGNAWGWSSARVIGLLAASALFFTLWAVIERRVREPMVDLGMLARPKMAATNAITFLVGFAMFSAFISLPNFVQMPAGLPAGIAERAGYGFGASPIESGLFFVPSSLAMIFAGPIAGSLGSRLGAAVPLRIGLLAAGSGLGLFVLAHDEPWHIYTSMALLGVGIGFSLAAVGKLAVDNARSRETGVASAINTIMRTAGAALGAQVAATIISANVIPGTAVPDETGFTVAFTIGTITVLAALVPTFVLTRGARRGRGVGDAELEVAA
ncbi:MAG: MFS transporter [Thermoleophilaceae bacterium]|jgi:EmrB/QacA subfamily drug resistance transporter